MKLGSEIFIVVSDYEIAKDMLNRDELADRPQWPFFHFYMKFNNSGARMAIFFIQSYTTATVAAVSLLFFHLLFLRFALFKRRVLEREPEVLLERSSTFWPREIFIRRRYSV